MTRLLLIHAGPTPWDEEDRLVGNQSLPLTEPAIRTIEQIINTLPHALSGLYRFKKNEATDQAAKVITGVCGLKPHDNSALDEVHMGLWQGLTRSELKFRFPSVYPQWEENPLAVNPPDGEMLVDAIERLRGAIKRIIKRNRGSSIALPLRPMAMQITLGLVRREDPQTIAGHLHNVSAVETIEISDEELSSLIA